MSTKPFEELIQQLALGSQLAAEEIVRTYEPEVRRFVRFRLSSPSIRRFVDSLDVTQSVLAKLFVELRKGEIKIQNSQHLRALLLTMARNKLYDQTRHNHAEKRDVRRMDQGTDAVLNDVRDEAATPSEQYANDEVVEMIRRHLTEEDLYLVDQRFEGRSWEDLASELGSTPEAVRKRMTRAVDRAAKQLGVV